MKVILYMAVSVNGLITGENDDTSWVSEEDFAGQEKVAREAGNIIYGRRTYEIGLKEKSVPVSGCLNVVMTGDTKSVGDSKNFLFTNKSPKDVVDLLREKGFSKIVVAGGSHLNSSFLRATSFSTEQFQI